MNVSESKFRQILREEARRVLREDAIAPTGTGTLKPGTPGVDPAGVVGNKEVAKKLRNAIEQFEDAPEGLNPMTKTQLINAINDLISKGRGSSVAALVTAAGAVSDDAEAKVKLGALLAALMGKQSTGAGSMRTVADNAHIGFNNRPDLAERLKNTIIAAAAQNRKAGEVVNALVGLASLASAPAPAPAAAPAAGTTAGTGVDGSKRHVIVAGDSISKIAATKYTPPVPLSNASMPIYAEIAKASGINVNSVLQIGQKIILPGKLSGGKYTLN